MVWFAERTLKDVHLLQKGLEHHIGPSGLFSRLYSWVLPTFQPIRASMEIPITLKNTCKPRYLQPTGISIIILNITNIIIICHLMLIANTDKSVKRIPSLLNFAHLHVQYRLLYDFQQKQTLICI